MQAIGSIAESIMGKTKVGEVYIEVFTHWAEIVGEQIAQEAEPYKITSTKKGKILVVRAINGKATELMHESLQLVESLNKHFKDVIFTRVKVIKK